MGGTGGDREGWQEILERERVVRHLEGRVARNPEEGDVGKTCRGKGW